MTRYVVLATDANPHYAIYAPVVTRIWQVLGYEPLLFVHDKGWDTALGAFVRGQLSCRVEEIAQCAPLTVGNTMRLVRVVAACISGLDPEALLLTSDMDMAPLSRTFFDRQVGVPLLLRADAYGSFLRANALFGFDGLGPGPALRAGEWRFPLCYVGMSVRLWREFLGLGGTPGEALSTLMRGREDAADHDEAITSRAILSSSYAQGTLQWIEGFLWRQGQLELVAVHPGPESKGGHARMLIHGQGRKWAPTWAEAIDFHMPRPAASWIGATLARLWPELAAYIKTYWTNVAKLAKLRD